MQGADIAAAHILNAMPELEEGFSILLLPGPGPRRRTTLSYWVRCRSGKIRTEAREINSVESGTSLTGHFKPNPYSKLMMVE